jgi:hypothetical protein
MFRIFLFLVIAPASLLAQSNTYKGFPSLVWPKLYSITFVKANDEHGEYDKPVFSDQVRSLEGKTVTLPGYMVPFDSGTRGSVFMLSSLPLNACFFCGVGGPETVVEVHLTEPADFSEKPLEVRGILRLNSDDPDKMIYILEKAEITGTPGF